MSAVLKEHWQPNVVRMPTLSSQVTPDVVITWSLLMPPITTKLAPFQFPVFGITVRRRLNLDAKKSPLPTVHYVGVCCPVIYLMPIWCQAINNVYTNVWSDAKYSHIRNSCGLVAYSHKNGGMLYKIYSVVWLSHIGFSFISANHGTLRF